ncbi:MULTISPECIES: MurR/RpiR family transcriptional regulator [Burkholderia]|uniref:MurR/RpiR family transcriptional regulator n=1 Tax=Burkholderia TaxID=32008 RepID=UPI0007526FD9|nr:MULTISPECIES: MurR/RpiR family transcriptional regulator [Burkholderia]AOJ67711.1 transcriptional regulator [Burkholderia savannae]KVG43578.1 transcriptional regulator [Burkholderia sp. MSMB0265]KVG88740.1 transcriptional regulator [Burkholderia sp. MSMB2040]KVG92913.1 transcriptional regulator [Burkholderia sp. MSMB2042]KVH02051.1 transcriptional regulator [Burkholderia sp. MSMB2041]
MLPRIEKIRAQLRPSERKLADFVLAAPREVLDLSMIELAARAGASQPTIARFCQALGCSGFREFKIRLAQSVAPGVASVYRDVEPDERAPGIIGKVFDRTIGALIEVRNSLSATSVADAIELLTRASRIEFYGAGGSGIAAQDIQHKFFRLGVPSVAYSDPHTFSMSAALLGANDVVVAISNTGRTRDIVDAARAARACGAKVISITHSHSPLAQLSTVSLASNVAEETDVFSPMTSRMSHLAIGDILAVGVALRRGPELVDRLGRAKEAITRRRIGVDAKGAKEATKDGAKDGARDTSGGVSGGTLGNMPGDASQEESKDAPKDASREARIARDVEDVKD